MLEAEGIRVHIDVRDNLRPGVKFFEWEKKGVPVRLEIGPRDLAAGQVVVARRDTDGKQAASEEGIVDAIKDLLEQIQNNLFEQALEFRKAHTVLVGDYDEFKNKLEGSFLLAHWCGAAECEAKIKEETKATIRCLPFDQPEEKGKCVYCGKDSGKRVIFAKSY